MRYETGPRFNFIYERHDEANFAAIAEAVNDSDIILLECVGGEQEERDNDTRAVNMVMGVPYASWPQDFKKWFDQAGEQAISQQLPFFLANHFMGQGKRLGLVDIPDSKELTEYNTSLLDKHEELLDNLFTEPNVALEKLVDDIAIDKAAMTRERNSFVWQELVEIREKAKKSGIKEIAVVQGVAGHTPVSHEAARQNIPYRRQFVLLNQFSSDGGKKAKFLGHGSLVRHHIFNSEKPASDSLVKCALLEFYISAIAVSSEETTLTDFTDRKLGKLSVSDVEIILGNIEEAKKRKFKANKVRGIVEAMFRHGLLSGLNF